MKKHIVLSLSLCYMMALQLSAQTAIGEFRSHISTKSFFSVAADDETVYAAANNGLMLLEKSSMYDDEAQIYSWSKVDGLSDIDIVKILYNKPNDALIICYNNGNIDIIRENRVTNISDVKDKQLSGSKRLNSCRALGDSAFLVYPFGIVIVDLKELIIADTWFTKRDNHQIVPTDVTCGKQKYYVSTEEGIFSIPKTSNILSDFTQWTAETPWNAFLLAASSDRIFAIKKADTGIPDSLFMLSDNGWENTGKSYLAISHMNCQHDTLAICSWISVELLDKNLERLYNAVWIENGRYPNARECVLDGDIIWVADNVYGLVLNNMTYYSHRFYTSSGPSIDYVESVTSCNGIVAAVHGSRKASTAFSPGFRYPSLSWYQNQQWYHNDYDFLTYDTTQNTYDLTNIAINPKDDSEWGIASWGNGIFLCKNQRPIAHYNAANSPLDSIYTGNTFVSGIQYDAKGNLWLTNSYSNTMLKMLEPNGTWHAYNITSGVVTNDLEEVVADNLLVDSRGYKWVNFPRDNMYNRYHLIAFTENGTYDNPGDDKLARVDMNVAAEVSSSTVYCMAEDLDGEIWIGTDKGIKVIYYPEKIFSGGAYPRNILLEQDGYVSVLFEYEQITAIAVDGANRKWIGTGKAGVFLMSENGQEQLLHFTAEDHPLFSNQIESINVNQLTGEVFFATSKGLVSYKGTATAGFETYEDLPVYPNPVPHGYSGMIAVNGLKTNSLCKITDSSGKLVWQGYSNGGQLVWDGKDHYGNRPASGVYYVMASDEDGKEKIVTKFVFVR